MKICSDVLLEKWTPDFTGSGQANPRWIRGRCEGIELFNSLEWMTWTRNPVQVVLCDACGHEGCASGGYVHVSHLGDFVLWTRPQLADESDDWLATQQERSWALKRFGAIAIPSKSWQEWRTLAPLPAVSELAPANGTAILDAWCAGPGRTQNFNELVPMLKDRLLYCDTIEPGDAIARIERWIERLKGNPAVPGQLRPPADGGARVETLYFNDWAEQGWPALAIDDEKDYLLLDPVHMFVPASSDP